MPLSATESAHVAVEAGLLVFPPKGEAFPGRGPAPMPFVIDSRGAGTNLSLRRLIIDGLTAASQQAPTFDVVAGVAKAGITWASWLAWEHSWPYATILLEGPRKSGLQREVEGVVEGKRVLLVDNWVRSGVSLREAVAIVRKAKAVPVGALAIARAGDADIGLPLLAIWTIEELMTAAQGLAVRRPT